MPLSDLIEHLINAKINLALERAKVRCESHGDVIKAERTVLDARVYIDRKFEESLQEIVEGVEELETQVKVLNERVLKLENQTKKVPAPEPFDLGMYYER